MELKINPELQKHIWPLRPQELKLLEENILTEGIRDKIITWQGFIVDGHNRFKIAQKYNLQFLIEDYDFDDIEDVKDWMDNNQLGRRNLTEDQWQISIGRRYNREKKAAHRPEKKDANFAPLKTSEKLADEYGVAPRTINNYGKKAEEFEKLKEEKPELAESIWTGEKSFKEIKKEEKIEQRKSQIEEVKKKIQTENFIMEGVFDVIVIDPPWAYDERGGFNSDQHDPNNNRGGVDYPTMTIEQIGNINLPEKDDTVLFLWTTHAFLRDAFDLLDEWGYTYKATIVWDKEIIGMGRNIRMQCEFCLLALKGKPIIQGSSERDIIREQRREHSRKPEAFYQMVERMTIGRKLDYFARSKREGWDIYGAETEKF